MERRYACPNHLFLFLFLLFLQVFAHVSMPQLNQTQSQIMQEISKSFLIISSNNTSWNTTDPNPCKWHGVNCSSSPARVVTHLSFSKLGLTTPTPTNSNFFSSLCRLDTLVSLDLSINSMTTLPDPLFGASGCAAHAGLNSLNLSSNLLSGELRNFSGFRRLEVLDLSYNSFSGNVGTQLESLPKLRSLNLSSNSFTGSIPVGIGRGGGGDAKARALEELVLSGNNFSGRIPSDLFEYGNLTVLDLGQNGLSGTVPDEFSKLPKLRILLLSTNSLSGSIPRSLLNVTALSRFAAYQNGFGGSIPSGMTKHVKTLDLSYNKLSGEIPSDLFSPPGLESVDFTSNVLEGSIPSNLSRSLFRLRLGGNLLNGSIPESIGNLSTLAYLELEGNHLEGSIPQELGNCKNLALLNLASNKLQGGVPKELGNLPNLVVLKLQRNTLGGVIPSELSSMTNLSTLNLSRNALTGEIPPGISRLRKLSILNLEGNKINGSIPNSISSVGQLIELELGDNELSGTIPAMPLSLTIALNLSHNHFSGSIPLDLGSLTELEILDLSYNNFSGQIPSSLSGLQSLTQLVLSYNHFSGILPKFPRWLKVDVTGNVDLVNHPQNTSAVDSRRKQPIVLFIIVPIVGAFVGLGLIAAVVLFSLSKRFYRVEDGGLPAQEGVPQVINGHFITLNGIHVSSIDFNKAMEAVSNHNNVFLKTRFCTYYKALMPNGAMYSVKKLNWSDKIFQRGNQEKFGQELELLGRLTNSNVMVPLAYVLTKDNAYLFYEHVYKGTVFDLLHDSRSNALDWASRYSIALGIAQGLTFLHGCTQPVVLLDLSTRTIHLKSLNEPQIGDIELHKVIDPSKSTGSLSTIAGTVGYIPPEYAYTMRSTMVGNVYSFGVILLELLTGKPSISNGTELAKWALSFSARPGERERILDTRVSKTSLGVRRQMLSVLNIALACVAFSPDVRPKMRNVLRMLFNAK